jgi:PAS domain S-box-containing protein
MVDRGDDIVEAQTRELARVQQELRREVMERRRAEVALRESEERFRRTFEFASLGIASIGADGVLLDVNPGLCQLLGYSRAELLAQRLRDLAAAEDWDDVRAVLERVSVGTGKLLFVGDQWTRRAGELEVRLRRKDGAAVWTELSVSAVRDDTEEILYFIAQVHDITARRNAIAAHQKLEMQLRQAQKLEAVGTLAGGLAHDFNNLLTGVMAGIQLALRHQPPGSRATEWLRDAQAAAERAADLTKQLLALSRRRGVEMGVANINEVVSRTARFLQRSLPEDVTVKVHLDPKVTPIRADAGGLEQSLLNLAINARDAMPGGGQVRFTTSIVKLGQREMALDPSARPGKFVCVQVADTGSGMSPEVVEHIFEPFFTTKEAGKGTGLGLAMVYNCAQAHDGWVAVDSHVGVGTRFDIYLPWIPMAEPVRDRGSLELPNGTETLLLVDDTDAVLYVGQRILESCGYQVLIARNGIEAIERFAAAPSPIALVITDLVMPGSGGRDLLAALAQRGAAVPVLLTSGHALDRDASEFLREGFAAFVPKPFDAAYLTQAVRRVLDRPTLR